MILAGQDLEVPLVFGDDRKSPMPADIVKGSDHALSVTDDKETISCLMKSKEVSILKESQFVRDQQPVL